MKTINSKWWNFEKYYQIILWMIDLFCKKSLKTTEYVSALRLSISWIPTDSEDSALYPLSFLCVRWSSSCVLPIFTRDAVDMVCVSYAHPPVKKRPLVNMEIAVELKCEKWNSCYIIGQKCLVCDGLQTPFVGRGKFLPLYFNTIFSSCSTKIDIS